MNYELVVCANSVAGPQLFRMEATSPFMAMAVVQFISQPGRPVLTIIAVAHEFLSAPEMPRLHRIFVATSG